ncbi:hypothetical protein WCLP8_1870005 [uncultured Gammaproteobacteria bacterium]
MSDNSRAALAPEYTALWVQCVPGTRPDEAPEPHDVNSQIDSAIKTVLAGKVRYQAVEAKTGVPWWVVGILHLMECNSKFTLHIHNGDPLTARTVKVPAGRPAAGQPPFTWEFSAEDAMVWKQWDLKNVRRLEDGTPDWTLPTTLWRMEAWNGFGYRNKGVRTPYLWAGSNLEQPGRYVADGVWDATKWSGQIGAAAVIKVLAARDLIQIQAQPA